MYLCYEYIEGQNKQDRQQRCPVTFQEQIKNVGIHPLAEEDVDIVVKYLDPNLEIPSGIIKESGYFFDWEITEHSDGYITIHGYSPENGQVALILNPVRNKLFINPKNFSETRLIYTLNQMFDGTKHPEGCRLRVTRNLLKE